MNASALNTINDSLLQVFINDGYRLFEKPVMFLIGYIDQSTMVAESDSTSFDLLCGR